MKKIVSLLLIILCLSGCQMLDVGNGTEKGSNSTENMDGEKNTSSEVEGDQTGPSLMQQVLCNQAEFYGNIDPYENECGWHKIEELEGYSSKDNEFGVVDFDRDGKREVYVYYMDALILYEQDGVIYGHCVPYRGLLRVCTNGTFEGADGGVGSTRMMNVSFNKEEMKYDYVTFETDYYTDATIYMKGTSIKDRTGWHDEKEEEITELEYNEILLLYPRGEDNLEYKLNETNVLEYVK